jgi:hypothetical protein
MSPGLLAHLRVGPNLPHHRGTSQPQRRLWAAGLTKAEAEDLLDWLERHGHRDCQVSHVAGEGFTVTQEAPWTG